MTPTSPSISRTLPGGASFPAAATGAAAATSRLAPIRQALMAPSHNSAQPVPALSFRTVAGDIITHARMAHGRIANGYPSDALYEDPLDFGIARKADNWKP